MAVAKKTTSATAKRETGFLDEVAGVGFDNVGTEDRAIPFLKLLQALSPQVQEDEPEYVKGAKPGMFCNSVTNKLYGREIEIVPVYFRKVWLEWEPNRGGLVGRHEPGSIEIDRADFGNWLYNGNTITETFMFFCLIADAMEEGPIVYPLQSTGIKHAKNWNTQIILTRLPSGKPAPYFSSVWRLIAEKYTNDSGAFYQIGGKTTNVDRVRFITEKEYTSFVSPTYEDVGRIEGRVDFARITDKESTETAF